MPLTEFELIDRYFARCTVARDDVIIGIGDDAAVLRVRAGHELVVATDTLLAGVHFPAQTAAADIGYRALAVNLSDLAAMGAEPAWATLALTLPEASAPWLQGFAGGFAELAHQHKVQLIGGDTSRGALSITVTVHGWVPAGQVLRRTGARPGDTVWVSGTLGDAALALSLIEAGQLRATADHEFLSQRFLRPQPRIALGEYLRGRAGSTIDISDGLAADLGHLLHQSGVGAVIEAQRLPLSAAMRGCVPAPQTWQYALAGGDDYELCFTAPAENREAILKWSSGNGLPLTPIGRIVVEPGLCVMDAEGVRMPLQSSGYAHF